jgi:hypothetical protein
MRYGLPVTTIGAGILIIELSAGIGWGLIVAGMWFAALLAQRATRDHSKRTPSSIARPGDRTGSTAGVATKPLGHGRALP